MKNFRSKQILKIVRIVWIIAGLTFIGWNFVSFQSKGIDAAILTSSAQVAIDASSQQDHFTPLATPANGPKKTGLLFYPGAMVDPKAYFPLLKQVAANGYPVYLIHLPYRLAPLPSHVEELFATTLATIEQARATSWVISGHSKGGALAVQFAHAHPQAVAGLVLIATTHPKDTQTALSTFAKPTLKIYATNDGLASREEIQQFSNLLPATTAYVSISSSYAR